MTIRRTSRGRAPRQPAVLLAGPKRWAPTRRSAARMLAVAALVAVGVSACSAEANEAPAAAADEVDVVAEDIGFASSDYTADAGPVGFVYRNDGVIGHTLLIEGVDGFKLEVAATGDVDEGSVDLAAGQYTIYCDVAGHRDAGMEAVLEVQ